MKLVFALVAASFPALAGEIAVLATGFHLRIERHEIADGKVRLFMESGVSELPAGQVVRFEYVPDPPKAPAAGESVSPAAAAAPAASAQPADPKQLLDEAADRYGLPRKFVHSVAKAESAFRVDALSPKGAIGLMQLMPATARELNADPHDPAQNADAGARYLRDLLEKYNHSAVMALAAYNAGPGAVDKHRGVPPYRETQNYVVRILRDYAK
jgi:soluble lytic murein transglycosylase-like protein